MRKESLHPPKRKIRKGRRMRRRGKAKEDLKVNEVIRFPLFILLKLMKNLAINGL
jgi:hypothetical protein